MKLAHFIHTLDDRAVSRFCRAICGELSKMGADVLLICATRNPAARVSIPEGVRLRDLEVGGRRTAFGIKRLASLLRDERPDVLFSHLNGPNRAAILARMFARVSTRIVTVEHMHYSGEYTGRFWRDQVTSLLYPRAARVGGISPGVISDLEEHFPKLRGKTVVLQTTGPSPLELEDSAGEVPDHPWFAETERVPIICSVANIIPRKRQDTLIRALPLIREEVGSVRLVLVGRFDDQEFLAKLTALTVTLEVDQDVWFAGYKDRPLSFMRASNVFAHSAESEAGGMVLLEALAAGVPTVAADAGGGATYALDNGSAGLLVPPNEPVEMASAIVKMLRDDGLRERLVARGRERSAHFAPRRVAEAYHSLAQELLATDKGVRV